MANRLLRGVLTFGSFTMVSRVLGLARDVVIGAVFGPSPAADAFFVAFKIPNFMRRLFAEGAFAHAFVPVLSAQRQEGSPAEVRDLAARVIGNLALVLGVLTVLGVVFAPSLVTVFAPGFVDEPERFGLAAEMLRWTFPYLLLISLTAAAGAVLNTYGSFGPPALAPVLLNLCLIGAALGLVHWVEPDILALALAVFVAGILQLLLQLPFLARRGLLAWPRVDWRHPGVRRVLVLMGPAVFGSSVAQINLLVDTVLASFLMAGSVSWLYFSDRLVELPLGVFGVALGTVILPRLSHHHAGASVAEFSNTLDWALRLALLIVLPSTVGLVMLSGPILASLFQYGAFAASDVYAARLSLAAYSFGLAGFVLVKVLAPGFFARQDTRTPVKCAAASMGLNMILSTLGVVLLLDTGVGHAALAGATAVAAAANAAMLWRGLRRRGVYRPEPGWGRLWRQAGTATLAMGAVLYLPGTATAHWIAAGAPLRIAWLAAALAGGAAVYLGVLWLLGLRPAHLREPSHRVAEE